MFQGQKLLLLAALAGSLWAGACGTDPTTPGDGDGDGDLDGDADGDDPVCAAPSRAVVVTTDYATGGASLLNVEDRSARPDLLTLHPDAVVRCGCGVVAVVERMGGDNIHLLDPTDLTSVRQFSLGRRTNPQDLWIDGEQGFVTLHETGEVAAVDLVNGEVTERLDLTELADADGQPEPGAITGLGDRIYVALQLLDRETPLWDPTGPAVLLVLRRDPLSVERTIPLEGSNPATTFRAGAQPGSVLIGQSGLWSEPMDGGIELIDLEAGESRGMIIGGEELGGSVIDFVIVGDELGFASVNVAGDEDRLVSFDPSQGRLLEVLASGPPYTLVRLILDREGDRNQLLVASRDPMNPGVRFFDAATGVELTEAPTETGLPPFDLCLIPEPLGMGGGGGDEVVDERSGQFVAEVTEFSPAEGASFGADRLPEVVLGPPEGGGAEAGSVDVLSLGCGGTIVLRFDPPIIDRPSSPDFIVFENAFFSGSHLFTEPAQVSASLDGEIFSDFPCDPTVSPPTGCAGVSPVFSNAANGIDPTAPDLAGGDAFDLADIGLSEARYLRLFDRSNENQEAAIWCGSGPAGFDLDGVAVVESRE